MQLMAKPPFDPTKPFKVVDQPQGNVVEEKPPFDPSKPFDVVDELPKSDEPSQTFRPAQAVIRKFGEGFTGGLSNVAAAAGRSLIEGTPFQQEREKIQKESEQISEQYPWTAGISKVAGTISPGSVFSKTFQALKRGMAAAGGIRPALQTLAAGTGATGLFGALEKSTNPKPETISEAASDILDQMALSAGIGIVGEGVARGVRAGRQALFSGPGLTRTSIETYANNPKAVSQIIKEKAENFVPAYAEKLNDQIRTFVKESEKKIDKLIQPHAKVPISITPMLNAGYKKLDEVMSYQPTRLEKEGANKIAEILDDFEKAAKVGSDGQYYITGDKLLQTRRSFQRLAEDYYENVAIGKNDIAARAAAKLADEANNLLGALNPEIRSIAQTQSQLINAQRELGIGNVFKKEGEISTTQMQRLLSTLHNPTKIGQKEAAGILDDVINSDLVTSSRFYKAAQEIGNPDAFSRSSTGRSVLKYLYLGPLGAAIESPAVQRGAIRVSEPLAQKIQSPGAQRSLFDIIRRMNEGEQ